MNTKCFNYYLDIHLYIGNHYPVQEKKKKVPLLTKLVGIFTLNKLQQNVAVFM